MFFHWGLKGRIINLDLKKKKKEIFFFLKCKGEGVPQNIRLLKNVKQSVKGWLKADVGY